MRACFRLAARLRNEGDLREGIDVQEAADIIYAAISWQNWQILVLERGWSPTEWTERTRELLGRMLTSGEHDS